MQIGTFDATADGYSGRIVLLGFCAELTLVAADPSKSENAPDYHILAGDWGDMREVGAGWKRNGEKAGAFIAVQIDDPSFAEPLRANLFQGQGSSHVLVWSRRSPRQPGE